MCSEGDLAEVHKAPVCDCLAALRPRRKWLCSGMRKRGEHALRIQLLQKSESCLSLTGRGGEVLGGGLVSLGMRKREVKCQTGVQED